MAQGSLVFGAATSDRASSGSLASSANLDPFSIFLVAMPTTLTAGRVLYNRGAAAQNHKTLRLSGTAGDLELRIMRNTTTTDYITNNAPLGTLNQYYYIGATFRSANGAGLVCHVYVGTTPANMAACTFGTTTDGSGTVTDDTTDTVMWGNASVTSPAVAFQGRICVGGIWGSELALADFKSLALCARNQVGGVSAKEFKRFGKSAADGIDYAGNANSVVTGATQGDGAPLLAATAPAGWTRRQSGVYVQSLRAA